MEGGDGIRRGVCWHQTGWGWHKTGRLLAPNWVGMAQDGASFGTPMGGDGLRNRLAGFHRVCYGCGHLCEARRSHGAPIIF